METERESESESERERERDGGGAAYSVHELGEGTGGVPAAPLPVQLGQRRQVVLEGTDAPRPGSGPGRASHTLGSGCRRTSRRGGGGGGRGGGGGDGGGRGG